MSGLNAESPCLAPSSSVADLLYSDDSVFILSLSWESFRGYVRHDVCEKDLETDTEG